jgi:hypothetical protein
MYLVCRQDLFSLNLTLQKTDKCDDTLIIIFLTCSFQLEAARIVTGATKLMSKHLLYEETRWEMLQTHRNNRKLIKFHEMFHKDAPDYLNSLVPPQVSETHQHNTRRSNYTVYLN